jgi:CotS family spore coat protein
MNIELNELLSDVKRRFHITINQCDKIQFKETEETGFLSGVFRLETDKGILRLKIYGQGFYNRQKLDTMVSQHEHLFSCGYTLTFRYLADVNGEKIIPIGNLVYLISDWIEGVHPKAENLEQMKATARSLAKFHRASEGYALWTDPPSPYTWTDHRYWESWAKEFDNIVILFEETLKELQGKFQKRYFEKQLLDDFPNYITEALEMQRQSALLKYQYDKAISESALKQGFVHDDLGIENVIISKDGNAYLIDMEDFSQKQRWHDITPLLTGLDILSFPNADYAREIISVYHHNYPLMAEEIKIIPLMLSPIHNLRWFLNLDQGLPEVVLDNMYRRSSNGLAYRINFREQVKVFLDNSLMD